MLNIEITSGKHFTIGAVEGVTKAIRWRDSYGVHWVAVAGEAPERFPGEQTATTAMLAGLGITKGVS